ncbi:MAG: hypothetical protein ACI8T1_001216 [Verrucomicrobiales bacterium]|jgi:hypothetical protein
MKKFALLSLSCLTAVLMNVSAEEAAKPVNTKCPFSGKDIDAEHTQTYVKVVGVCCEKCQAKITGDIAGNMAKIAEVKATHVNTKCPVSGKAIDAEKLVDFKGAKVAVCCEKCQANFDAEKHGAKVVMDNAGNDKCVFSGKEIDAEANAVVSIKVGVCCGKCAKKFAEDPKKAMAKVEFSKAG